MKAPRCAKFNGAQWLLELCLAGQPGTMVSQGQQTILQSITDKVGAANVVTTTAAGFDDPRNYDANALKKVLQMLMQLFFALVRMHMPKVLEYN